MNKPERQKLTCKGNVPAKLASKGVDSAKLYHYVQTLTTADADIADAVQLIADAIVDAIDTAGIGAVNNAQMGATYQDNYRAQLVADITACALGTASQGRAFKQTVVDNTDADLSDFASDGKASAKVDPADDPYANL